MSLLVIIDIAQVIPPELSVAWHLAIVPVKRKAAVLGGFDVFLNHATRRADGDLPRRLPGWPSGDGASAT
jgi:hypothetical protein